MIKDCIESYLLTEEKEEFLWNEAVIVFDSSALLDIYFVPKNTRIKIYTDVFEKLPNRLWVSSHIQYEYMKNRESCIAKPVKEKYEPLRKKVQDIDAFISIKKAKLL